MAFNVLIVVYNLINRDMTFNTPFLTGCFLKEIAMVLFFVVLCLLC